MGERDVMISSELDTFKEAESQDLGFESPFTQTTQQSLSAAYQSLRSGDGFESPFLEQLDTHAPETLGNAAEWAAGEVLESEGTQWEELELADQFDVSEASRGTAITQAYDFEQAETPADQLEEVEAPLSAEVDRPAGHRMSTLDELLLFEAGAASSLAERIKGVTAFVLGPALRRGDQGPAVAALQRALVALGYDLVVDAEFGIRTEQAVRGFQARAGIRADGAVGPMTKSSIAAALAHLGQPPVLVGPAPASRALAASALCDAIARVAEQEYRRWHLPGGALRETDAGATPILQRYYREGVGVEVPGQDLQDTTWQASHPWSAVFVSWVMRTAGAGDAFRYSRAHQTYIRAARRNRLDGNAANPFWAYRATEIAPMVGDLICASRANSGATYDNIGDAQVRSTHCDIVTEVRPGQLRVIGGNVRQNVDAKRVRTVLDGRLALDGAQSRFFAVVRCRGSATGAEPA